MKFLADMGISPVVVRWLREMGHDAVHLYEEDLGRLPDSAVLEKARAEGRILLTHDLDFGELLAFSKSAQPSVLYFEYAICARNPFNIIWGRYWQNMPLCWKMVSSLA